MNLGPAEILVILVVALIVFGPKKLPDLSRQLGRGMRELRSIQRTFKGELDSMLTEADAAERPSRSDRKASETQDSSAPSPNGSEGRDTSSSSRDAEVADVESADAEPTDPDTTPDQTT